jgi:hypothetical protein
MDRTIFQQNLNKKVKIICKDGYLYTCQITQVLDNSFQIKDKFENLIWIDFSNVQRLDEVSY